MMAEGDLGIFRGRLTMHEGYGAEGGLGGRASVEQTGNFLANRNGVERIQFGEDVVGMLMIDQGLAMISFAGLKELGKARVRRGQRLR